MCSISRVINGAKCDMSFEVHGTRGAVKWNMEKMNELELQWRNEANPVDDPLFEALRARRRELAETAGVPPYVIFHDATLRELAGRRPQNLSDFAMISGVGARKLEAYGEAFLTVIRGQAEG